MLSAKRISLVAGLILLGVIYFQSSIETFPVEIYGFSFISLAYHFGVFFMLGLAFALAGFAGKRHLPIVLFTGLIYAGLDELHQYFVPGRVCTLGDWVIDSIGVLCGVVVYLLTSSFNRNT